MSKSSIYATVKTVQELLLPFLCGMVTVIIHEGHGFYWSIPTFVVSLVFGISCTYLGDWILKKCDVKNY